MVDCIFATYAALPDLDPHDRLVMDALRDRDISSCAGVWSDPSVEWSQARLCVVRSTWDYPAVHHAFLEWLERVSSATKVRNDPETLRWNAHKFYLRDLQRAGVPVVPTEWLNAGECVRLDRLMERNGWSEAIVKPSYGGSSWNVLHVESLQDARDSGQRHLDRLLDHQDVLVQPFLHTLEAYPERALIFIGGAYSHTVTKTPFQTALPSGEAGDAPLVDATPDEVAVAQRAIAAAPAPPMYARVDLVRDDAGAPRVLELELIEPTLFLGVHPQSVDAFADAIAQELRAPLLR